MRRISLHPFMSYDSSRTAEKNQKCEANFDKMQPLFEERQL